MAEVAKGIGFGAIPPRQEQTDGAYREDNRLRPEDRAVHDWYRFVLSFPPHLVREYLTRFGVSSHGLVLDPFCGTGTTLVECKKLGIPSVGVDPNPIACFASRVKVDWSVNPDLLLDHARAVVKRVEKRLLAEGLGEYEDLPLLAEGRPPHSLRSLPLDAAKLLLRGCISELPLHKTLVLLEELEKDAGGLVADYERLALAKTIVFTASNLHFGPEVGVGPPKLDAPVLSAWLRAVATMADDLRELRTPLSQAPSIVHREDARNLGQLKGCSVDAVITSPPYPNEKDYTRTTRLESVILGFIENKGQLRLLKERLVRSNTRNVYKNDDDDLLVAHHPEIQRIAEAIEARRTELGKTSGWERMYPRVTRLYFGGMARHLSQLRAALRPGANLAYVVGDQASFLRVMIRTGEILADLARSLGYEVIGIDLYRTRRATATKELLREEVVVLRWPG